MSIVKFALYAAALSTTAHSAFAQEMPDVSWNVSMHGNPRGITAGIEEVAKFVEENTQGSFKIKLNYGEALSPAKETIDGIQIGAFEMALMCASYHPGKTPSLMVLDLPMLPIDNMDTKIAVHEAVFQHPQVKQELAKWDADVYMSALTQTSEFMGVGEAPTELNDWKGRVVRAPGGLGEAMSAIGATPTTVPAPEVYTALERGTVNAVSFPFTTAHVAFGVHDVAKWYTDNMAPGTTGCQIIMSKSAWDNLPENYQQIMMDAKAPAYEALKARYEADDEENLKMLEERGLEKVSYSPETLKAFQDSAAKPVWDNWVNETSNAGVPAQELLDLVIETSSE
ncbi:TRAP-type C4-dicarboxylate transport system substrate-binding protein [Roseovarius halotolerans]|uniref:Monocarboxylate 2-oxoacid-binding periplasmic protein n=1 Tax=Roseovarius halotolerans TaxID=505353 RepID=A0A1X6ZYL0_9RHOB|nr:TRAP transporter substrate-binding protein DctP [Roseovarius halotolerans]RKT27702.1 TRAP-type C4-dicarboxylate transport system substrate-binding protein [Roseovarius halotolerans]SLN64913.1 Monocarboxylate 2-oxoacid-binding periplasmic protein precursor [Roseovarius halotolerans]